MDDRTLDHIALSLGVVATVLSGLWSYTESTLVGVVTIVALLAVSGAILTILARPLPDEVEPEPEVKEA